MNKLILRVSTVTALLILGLAATVGAFQGREHLTPQEIDLVKDAQELDKRIDIFADTLEFYESGLTCSLPDAHELATVYSDGLRTLLRTVENSRNKTLFAEGFVGIFVFALLY